MGASSIDRKATARPIRNGLAASSPTTPRSSPRTSGPFGDYPTQQVAGLRLSRGWPRDGHDLGPDVARCTGPARIRFVEDRNLSGAVHLFRASYLLGRPAGIGRRR